MTAFIYKIESLVKPQRIYIGSTVYLRDRWKTHRRELQRNNHHARKLQRHYNKYGESDLVFSIIEQFPFTSNEFLLEREQCYLDTLKPYFNSSPTAGNCLGYRHPESVKRAMREKRPPVSIETREKQSLAKKGKPSPNKGCKYSDEKRLEMYFKRYGHGYSVPIHSPKGEKGKKISLALTGKKLSSEHKKKLSLAKKGKKRPPLAEEHKKKIGLGNKGKVHPPHSPATKEKIRQSLLRFLKEHPRKVGNNRFL